MNLTLKKILLWFFALIFVLGARTYQKYTGPTYPKRENISIEGNEYKFKLTRSHGGDENCKYGIVLGNEAIVTSGGVLLVPDTVAQLFPIPIVV